MFESLGFDAVYWDDHVADLQLVGSVCYAARFQIAYPRPTVLVSPTCYGQAKLRVIRPDQLNKRTTFLNYRITKITL